MTSPDFEKELLDAARFDGSRPVFRFSWSYFRERLFRRCRRAYFIGCCLSQGGWDPPAHPLIRSAYREKNQPSFRLWLSRTVQNGIAEGLKKALARPPESRRKAFTSGYLRFFSGSLFDLEFSLKHGEYREDSKRPCVRECLDEGRARFPGLRRQALDSFSAVHAVLSESPLFQEMLLLETTDFRFGDVLLSLRIGQCPVWFSPGLVFFRRGRFHMLSASSSLPDPDAEERLDGKEFPDPDAVAAALFDLHVRTNRNGREPLAHLLRFGPEGAGLEEIRSAEGVETLVRAGAEAMFSLIRPDGSVFYGDFPKTGDPDRCRSCPYAGTCRLLDEWAQSYC